MEPTTAIAAAVDVAKMLKNLANWNTAKATDEYEEHIEQMTLCLAAQHSYEAPPTGSQVGAAVGQFVEEAKRATNDKKVQLLQAAFFGMFNPKFYDAGWNQILWDMIVRLEYPDTEFLRGAIERYAADRTHVGNPGVSVDRDSPDFTLAQRLISVGLLVVLKDSPGLPFRVAPTGVCEKLREFLWSSPDAPAEPAAD